MLKFAISAAILTLTLVMGAGCQNSSGKSTPSEGSSSGGGGFGDEASMTILHWASEDLADQIENSSPEIYAKLPSGWTQKRLADVIRNVRPRKEKNERAPEISRYGLRLIFADVQAEGYITATQLFLDTYSSYEVNKLPKASFFATIEEVKLRMVHEAAHLMGLGNTQATDTPEARKFAEALMDALDRDNVECMPSEKPPKEMFTSQEEITSQFSTIETEEQVQKHNLAFVINRASGRGMSLTNAAPNNMDGVVFGDNRFDFQQVEMRLVRGLKAFGGEDGTFSWNAVDERKAVITDEGYRSDYKYSDKGIDTHLDFKVVESDAAGLVMETLARQESPEYRNSEGRLKIEIKNAGGVGDGAATGTILMRFNHEYVGEKSGEGQAFEPITIELKCHRTFRALNQ